MPEKNNRKDTDFPLLFLSCQELRALRHIWLAVKCALLYQKKFESLSTFMELDEVCGMWNLDVVWSVPPTPPLVWHKIYEVVKDKRGMCYLSLKGDDNDSMESLLSEQEQQTFICLALDRLPPHSLYFDLRGKGQNLQWIWKWGKNISDCSNPHKMLFQPPVCKNKTCLYFVQCASSHQHGETEDSIQQMGWRRSPVSSLNCHTQDWHSKNSCHLIRLTSLIIGSLW